MGRVFCHGRICAVLQETSLTNWRNWRIYLLHMKFSPLTPYEVFCTKTFVFLSFSFFISLDVNMEIPGSLSLSIQTRQRTLESHVIWSLKTMYECMLLWKPQIAKIICSGLERYLTDYVQVHTCVFHYLTALGGWCLSWQIYLLKQCSLAGRITECLKESPNAESKIEGTCNVQKAWGSYKASRKK